MQDEIQTAIEEQSVGLLRAAFKRTHPCPGEHGLHEAVRQANVGAIKLLLQARAEPNARCLSMDKGCEFPLQLAVTSLNYNLDETDRCQAVELLLRAGAQSNPRRGDAEANTPLHDAVRRGELGVVRALLRHAVDPNSLNGYGETPICLAVRLLSIECVFAPHFRTKAVVETLLEAGASPLVLNSRGQPLAAGVADPALREFLARWSAWWRCRHLAWIHSRAGDHPIHRMMPELLTRIGNYL